MSTYQELSQLLQESKELEFISSEYISKFANTVTDQETLLHIATTKVLPKAVDKLLWEGAQLIKTRHGTALELAASFGYYEVFDMFFKHQKEIPDHILVNLLKKISKSIKTDQIDYRKCIDRMLEKNSDINVQGRYPHNASLHYVARYGTSKDVLDLLRRKASLVIKNIYGELPIEDIDVKTLEIHFDECIKSEFAVKKKQSSNAEKEEDRILIYDYTTLMPPTKTKFIVEMEAVFYMSIASQRTKQFLVHPLIAALLYRKWQKIKYLFYSTVMYYTVVYALLVAQIVVLNENSNFLKIVAYMSYSLLILAEIFILIFLRMEYWEYKLTWAKNLLEFSVLVSWGLILWLPTPTDESKTLLSVVAVLFSACDYFLLLSHHPNLGVYILMWYTILLSYIKFMPCLVIAILVFTLAFHIIFKITGCGIFNTILMLVGENGALEFSELTLLGRSVFVAFVFLMVIVFMNFLNAMAVCDTQRISQTAKIEGQGILARQIYYLEKLILTERSLLIDIFRQQLMHVGRWVFVFPIHKNTNERYRLEIAAEPKRRRMNQKCTWTCRDDFQLSTEIIQDTLELLQNRRHRSQDTNSEEVGEEVVEKVVEEVYEMC